MIRRKTQAEGWRHSGRSKQRPHGILVRQHVWAKKAGASSRTPQNPVETSFGVRRLAAAFAGASGAMAKATCPGRDAGATLREKTLGEFLRNSRKGGAGR